MKDKLRMNQAIERKNFPRNGRVSAPRRRLAACPTHATDARQRQAQTIRNRARSECNRCTEKTAPVSECTRTSRTSTRIRSCRLILLFLSQFDSFSSLSTIPCIFYYFCHSFVVFLLFIPKNALLSSPLSFFRHDV